jgi:hypothetical protein
MKTGKYFFLFLLKQDSSKEFNKTLGGAHKEGFYKECNLMVNILPLKMLRERVLNLDSLASFMILTIATTVVWKPLQGYGNYPSHFYDLSLLKFFRHNWGQFLLTHFGNCSEKNLK